MVSELTWIGHLSQVIEARDSYFLVLSPQSISKRRLGWLSFEGCIVLSKRNSIPSIFSFWCRKLGILIEEEFLSEPDIGFLSSSKSKFRDLGQDFWLGETLGKSNHSLTPSWKNPKILELISFGTFSISSDWRRIRRWNFHRPNIKALFTLYPKLGLIFSIF